MGVSNIILEKPSKIHNLGYFILGYSLTTLFTFKITISVEESIFLITTFGSIIGATFYYIKPIERMITLYFKIFNINEVYVPEVVAEFTTPVYKSEILFSHYMNDERTIINGVFFLSISFLLSDGLLKKYNLSQYYIIAQLISIILILAGLWEIYILIKRKMPNLVFYYNFFNYSKKIDELESALNNKDWIKAQKIRDQEWHLEDPETYMKIFGYTSKPLSFCPTCLTVKKSGGFCIECGHKLIQNCPKCNEGLVYDENQSTPKYCKYCGQKIVKDKQLTEENVSP